MSVISRWIVLAGITLCAACGSSDGTTVRFEMEVIEFSPGMQDVPISGVEVCELETDNCETTDDSGFVVMRLPSESEVTLSVIKEGYGPTLSPQLTEGDDITGLRTAIIQESTVRLLALTLGTPFPLEGGVIAISAITPPLRQADNGVAGVTYAIDGATPYYLDELGFPTFNATATSEPDGVGGYVELADGIYDVAVGGTGAGCEIVSAWPDAIDNQIRLPAQDGFITQAFIACESATSP